MPEIQNATLDMGTVTYDGSFANVSVNVTRRTECMVGIAVGDINRRRQHRTIWLTVEDYKRLKSLFDKADQVIARTAIE